MSYYFEIKGGKKISGTIKAGGSKNASFPVLAATILLNNKIIIDNLPDIEDIRCFLKILKSIGVKIKYINKKRLSKIRMFRIYP